MSSPRSWHTWYKKFANSSKEVRALYILEPDSLPDWAVSLRQEFPTIPPKGVEMCHARWPETLDRLLDDIAEGVFTRRAHWCGDLPLETVAGLGLRRRVLIAWLNNVPREKVMGELAEGLGAEPMIADLLYDVLGEVSDASSEVRQDIEFIADLFSGPYEAGNAPIYAKWKARLGELEGRGSVLAELKEQYFPVLTNLCNYRTLGDVDRLIGMVARQMLSLQLLGPCNWSLKFLLQDEPERLGSSIAVVWALHRYAADEFRGEVAQTPLGVRDQTNALLKRLGHSDEVKAWLAASLGFLVKKWVRRAWHIMEIDIPEDALPDFSFPEAPAVKDAERDGIGPIETSGASESKEKKHSVVSSSSGKKRSKAPSLASLPTGSGEESGDASISDDDDDGAELSTARADVAREAVPDPLGGLDSIEEQPVPPPDAVPAAGTDHDEGEDEGTISSDEGPTGADGETADSPDDTDGAESNGAGDETTGSIPTGDRMEAESGTDGGESGSASPGSASESGERVVLDESGTRLINPTDDWEEAITIGGRTRVLSPSEREHEGEDGSTDEAEEKKPAEGD